jgi:hypothetical protein
MAREARHLKLKLLVFFLGLWLAALAVALPIAALPDEAGGRAAQAGRRPRRLPARPLRRAATGRLLLHLGPPAGAAAAAPADLNHVTGPLNRIRLISDYQGETPP